MSGFQTSQRFGASENGQREWPEMLPAEFHSTTEQKSGQASLFPTYGLPVRVQANLVVWRLLVNGVCLMSEWRGPVLEGLRARYSNQSTAASVAGRASRVFDHFDICGAREWSDVDSQMCDDFYWAAYRDRMGRSQLPAHNTARDRQWIVMATLEVAATLGAPVDPLGLVGERIPRICDRVSPARPLDEAELERAKAFADPGVCPSRRSVLVALSLSGGNSREVAAAPVRDVNLDTATVTFRGKSSRTNPLDEWSVETLALFISENPSLGDDDLLAVTKRNGHSLGATIVSTRLTEVLRDAGLADKEGITARSFRLTTAHRIFAQDGIAAVARFLGVRSLDTAAAALGYDWQNEHEGSAG